MKHLPAISEILLSFFTVTIGFTVLNDSAVFPYPVMEILWLFYPAILSFLYAYFFGLHYSLRGGGIFLSFCLIAPWVILSFLFQLPWGDFFFAPLPLIAAGIAAILGEAFGNVKRKISNSKASSPDEEGKKKKTVL